MKRILLVIGLLAAGIGGVQGQTVFHYWNFNAGALGTGGNAWPTPLSTSARIVGTSTITHNFVSIGGNGTEDFGGSTGNAQSGDPAGVAFCVQEATTTNNGNSFILNFPTTGYENVILEYDTRGTTTGFANQVIDYSTDGITFTNLTTLTGRTNTTYSVQTLDFSSIALADNNSNFKVRITVTGATSAGGNNRFDNITLEGTLLVCTPPSVQASNIAFSNIGATVADVSWTAGTGGDAYLVVAREGSPVSFSPTDVTDYTSGANADFSLATDQGSGNKVVFAGPLTTATITGLTAQQDYYFQVYSYCSSGYDYLNTDGTGNDGLQFLTTILLNETTNLIYLNTPYLQDFDGLATSGTTNDLGTAISWSISEAGGGTRDNEQYGADNGGSGTGDTYSYGSSTDRALGSVASGTLQSTFGTQFTNSTGGIIRHLAILYTGEQWRRGDDAANTLNFQYSTSATSISTGTWVDLDILDMVSPITTGSNAALDGNLSANRTEKGTIIYDFNLPDAGAFWIRWVDANDAGADDGLAVDDFKLVPYDNIPWYASSTAGSLLDVNTNWTLNETGNLTTPFSPNPTFSVDYQTYNAQDAATYNLNANLDLSALANSKLVVGDGTNATTITVPTTAVYQGIVDVSNAAKLQWENSIVPSFGTIGTSSTVEFNAAAAIAVPAETYGNLTLNGDGIKTLAGTVTVDGTLELIDGATSVSGQELVLNNGFVNSDPFFASISLGSGTLTVGDVGGAANLTLPDVNIDILNVSRASGVTLSNETTVGTLNLISGNVVLGDADLVLLNAAPAGSAASYVQADGPGRLRYVFNFTASRNFPVGTATSFAPVTLDPLTTSNFAVGVDDNAPFGVASQVVNHTWDVNRTSGTGAVTQTLQWNSAAEQGDFVRTNPLNIFHEEVSTPWTELGTSPLTAASLGGSNYSLTATNTIGFSDFGVGETDSPLPVELLSFSGAWKGTALELKWNTASELNNDRFEVQRSLTAGATDWATIGSVPGTGTSTEAQAYSYMDVEVPAGTVIYYRLRQVDIDGTASISNAISVSSEIGTSPVQFVITPNPSQNDVQMTALNQFVDASDMLEAQVLTNSGVSLLTLRGTYLEVSQAVETILENAPSGLYLVNINYRGRSQAVRVVRQ